MGKPFQEWPFLERNAASEMNWGDINDPQGLMAKWRGRFESQKNRSAPSWDVDYEQATGLNTGWGDWGGPSTKLWVPPWGRILIARVHVSIDMAVVDFDVFGEGFVRLRVGTIVGESASVRLECAPDGFDPPKCQDAEDDADGTPLDTDVLYEKEVQIEFAPGDVEVDAVNDIIWQVRTKGECNAVKIKNSTNVTRIAWNWAENDVS